MSAHPEELLSGYVDDEIDRAARDEVDAHLESCPSCRGRLERLRGLSAELLAIDRYTPPAELAEAIRSQVRAHAEPKGASSRRRPAIGRWGLASIAAALGVAAGLVLFATLAPPRGDELALSNALRAAHIRSLMVDHATDVTSDDRHRVRPWFAGKVDFSPPVLDLRAEGFPLEGGRLEYVSDRTMVAIVYMRRAHLINLFVWKSDEGDAELRRSSAQGFQQVQWREGGFAYCAVSDLNAAELNTFAEHIRLAQKASPGPATPADQTHGDR